MSALLVEGTTLDKFSKKLAYKSSIENNVKDYIIVDEVSMMREQFYKVLSVVKRVKPDTKFIITGHYRQFKPVNDRINKPTSYYANSQVLYELCDGNHLKLTNCRRSSDTLYEMLKVENINNIDLINRFSHNETLINITFTNKKRKELNKKYMEKHVKENAEIQAQRVKNQKNKENPYYKIPYLEALEYDGNSQNVIVYKGLPLKCKKNCKDKDIYNNERFTVKQVTYKKGDWECVVYNKRLEVTIKSNEFQNYFYPAYAITAHCSQGLTINEPFTIYEYNRLNDAGKYVVLSRASDEKFINIL